MGTGMGAGGGKAGFDPSKIAGLAAWFDASDLSTLTLDGTNVNGWKCKKTQKTLLPVATDTTRPTYDPVNKTVDFLGAAQQRVLLTPNFFTVEPFKSATKGFGQAWSMVVVASSLPNISIGSLVTGTVNNNFRASGSSFYGGALQPIFNTQPLGFIKSASANSKCLLDTIKDSTPFNYSECSPDNVIAYNGLVREPTYVSGTNPTNSGDVLSLGTLNIGNWGSIYWTGNLKEFILYDRAITEEELLRVITLLKSKWGI